MFVVLCSTYSTLYNHPTKIVEPRSSTSVPKVKLSRKTGIPLGVIPGPTPKENITKKSTHLKFAQADCDHAFVTTPYHTSAGSLVIDEHSPTPHPIIYFHCLHMPKKCFKLVLLIKGCCFFCCFFVFNDWYNYTDTHVVSQ